MSATQAPPAQGRSGRAGRLRRHRGALLVAAALVVAVAVVLWTSGEERTHARLDPANPDAEGARAVARVLEDQGVDLSVVRGAAELKRTEAGPGTTVVVTSTQSLGGSTLDRLLAHARGARLVLVDPGVAVTDALGLGAGGSSDPLGSGREADCDDPLFEGLTIEVDSGLSYPGSGCFGDGHGGALLVEHDDVRLFGAGDALANDQVLRADNAAVVLRLLGQDRRLVWYVPQVEDLVGEDEVSLGTLLPDWIRPAIWLLALTVLGLVLWRGRRLGPLATEPMPVVVKAIETTLSRGRLYRRAGDREHAAQALRRAARDRAAQRLGRGASRDPQALVRDVARHIGRAEAEVDALIGPHAAAPATDAALIALASHLAELDREVRRT
ncbi:DUF4350 domain-containing protein [Nocardioides sp. cx-169]|uniref:DUF4350 domain-containing protein n=1 Tax=Nocardioides sp. cx-169 TaxID=2899080 RepID=UPI001E64B604|nr:DUF4350 domain-containing protein [Nocardioides sp. cx-169]MCD4536193.1 DUF4350 domain-containing protein [Nocardioides sp. cx-169]